MTVALAKQLLALPWIDSPESWLDSLSNSWPDAWSSSWSGAWMDLPDSLETLGNLAVQLQKLTTAAISHPILAIVALLLGIGLLQLAADLVKRTIQASLKFVLTLPLILSQRLWQQITTKSDPPNSRQTKVDQLLDRLETLRQEQDQIIAELKPLLSTSAKATASGEPREQLASASLSQPAATPPLPMP